MKRLRAFVIALLGVLRLRRRGDGERERIVPEKPANRRAENTMIVLLLAAAACGVGFLVIYATEAIGDATQFLGLALGLAFAFLAAACFVAGQGLVSSEEQEEDYPELEHREDVDRIEQMVEESGSGFTRKGLVKGAAGAAAAAVGGALITPALSFGPALDTESLFSTPWRRDRRLVDEHGRPLSADAIEENTFYTAFPEHESQDTIGAPLVVVRLQPAKLHLPRSRAGWAPEGILAFSKICTHAGCAISLYRKPTYPPTQPRPALVCPCHYSTFDPATGGKVIFGPAGRPLPQLPLYIDAERHVRAAGDFAGPVGPSFWGVRKGRSKPT